MLPIGKDFGFMENKICHNIKNSFNENRDLLINTQLEKALSQLNWDMDRWIRSLFAS